MGVNAVDDRGFTPLMWAALMGNCTLVDLLLEIGGADPSLRDKEGQTAMEIASYLDQSEIVASMQRLGPSTEATTVAQEEAKREALWDTIDKAAAETKAAAEAAEQKATFAAQALLDEESHEQSLEARTPLPSSLAPRYLQCTLYAAP